MKYFFQWKGTSLAGLKVWKLKEFSSAESQSQAKKDLTGLFYDMEEVSNGIAHVTLEKTKEGLLELLRDTSSGCMVFGRGKSADVPEIEREKLFEIVKEVCKKVEIEADAEDK